MYGGVPEWLITAFRKRIDEWEQRMQTCPKHREKRKLATQSFDRLQTSFSREQLQLFMEWEEHMSFQVSGEKEKLYIRGFLDGFQLYACLDEISGWLDAGKRNGKESPDE